MGNLKAEKAIAAVTVDTTSEEFVLQGVRNDRGLAFITVVGGTPSTGTFNIQGRPWPADVTPNAVVNIVSVDLTADLDSQDNLVVEFPLFPVVLFELSGLTSGETITVWFVE